MKFKTIYADPPWPYNHARAMPIRKELLHCQYGGNVSSEERYGAISIESLKALPVPVADTAHLYLWTTNAFIAEAHEVARAWGFKPKTILTWVKVKKTGEPSMASGYYYRGASEHLLFAVRGSMRLAGPCRPTAYLLPRLPHSVKPDFFYDLIEEQSPGPYLELFARRLRRRWKSWGNQIESNYQLAV
jgi:N6-adenosine-specific RNA methylase IME4